MGHIANTRATLRSWLLLAALGLAALAMPSQLERLHESSWLTLADLDRAHDSLMSCDGESGARATEVLWCADPASPLCIPAVPPTPHPDLWDGQLAAVPVEAFVHAAPIPLFVTWQRPVPERALMVRDTDPLEKPPRG